MVLTKSSTNGFDSPLARIIIFIVLGGSVLVAAVAGWLLFDGLRRSEGRQDLIRSAELLLSTIKDVETGHRGYIIVGSKDYLTPYTEAMGDVPGQLDSFKATAAANDVPQAAVDRIADLIDMKVRFAETGVGIMTAQSPQAAREHMATGSGRTYMDLLRKDIAAVATNAQGDISARYTPAIDLGAKMLEGALVGLALASGYFLLVARQARRRNQRATELVADVIDNAPVGLSLIDEHGVMRASNAAFADIIGKPDGSIDNLPFKDVAPDLHEKIHGKIALYQAIKGGREQRSSANVQINEGGRAADVEVRLFPVSMEDASGNPSAGVGIVLQDITRQKQWERDLEKARDAADAANRAKSSFIANMSHELRTPLTAVLGYCELLEEDLADQGQQQLIADLNKISINAKHLLGLINDVLDLSKIEAERMDVHAVPFQTRSMLAEVESAVGSLVAKKNNRLAFDVGRIEPAMNTDDLKLKQVLLNLIGNAAKFTENGTITVKVEPAMADDVPVTRFSVIDTGIGMTEDQLANLFQRFKQADETTTRKFGGTGLGLALTRALTTMLGGDIKVASEANKGSTFSVDIPNIYIAPQSGESASSIAAHEAKHGEKPSSQPQTHSKAILVIDDDPSQRDLMTRHLTKEGFAVVTCDNGVDGVAKAREIMPAAILLDIMMPGMNGWHVMRELRSDPATADLPIIIQTVLDEASFAYSLGATDYLKKPVDRAKLGDMLKELRHDQPDDYVLIVDDDADVRGTLAEMFKRDKWEVVEAADGSEALAQIGTRLPALVIADLVMPVMDGYQFVAEVRKNPKWADLPIVVLTSEDLSKASVRELMAKTSQVVQKGTVPLGELVASLRSLTERVPVARAAQAPGDVGERIGE